MSLRRLYEDFNINKTAGNLTVDVMGENKEKDFEIVKEILGDDYDFFDQDFEAAEMPVADLEVDDIIETDPEAEDTNQEDDDFIAVNDEADKEDTADFDFEETDAEDQDVDADVDAEDDTKNASDTEEDAIEVEEEAAVEENEVPDEVEDLVAEIEETPADENQKVMVAGDALDNEEVDESLEEDYDDFDNDLFDDDLVQDATDETTDETDYDDYEDFADFNGMWVEKEEPMDWPDPFEAEEKYTENASEADEEYPIDEACEEACKEGECEEELTEAKDKEYKAFTVQEIKDRLSRFIESKEEPEKLDGMDNAVVDCQTDMKVITHSEDEKPLDCDMKKDPLPKALTEDAEEDDMSDEEFLEAVGRDVISKRATK